MSFDVRTARIVLECARAGSIGRAAEALGLAQPAVTRALKRLEDEMEARLFERTTRGVVPTAYGTALLPYAETLVSEAAQARDLVRQMRGASRGMIRVGGVGSVVSGLLVEAVTALRRARPELRFHVVEALEDSLLDELKMGRIDLAVSPEPYIDDEVRLAAPDSFGDEVAAFVRRGHPAAPGVSLEQAAALDWAMPPDTTPVTQAWYHRFHAASLEPAAPGLISRSVSVILAAVRAGDFACWMPQTLIADDLAAGHVVPLEVPGLTWHRTFRVYRRRRGRLSPAADLFLEELARCGAARGPEGGRATA